MAFIESSPALYVPPPVYHSGAAAFAFSVSADFTPRRYSPYRRAAAGFTVAVAANLRPRNRTRRGLLFRVAAQAVFAPQSKLVLTMPPPILPTSANFRNGFLTARLFQNGISIPVKAFTVSAPKDSLSKAIAVQVGAFDRAAIDPAGAFKFEIGQKQNHADNFQWFTVADGAKLQTKNFNVQFPVDTLSFVASAEDNVKLQTAPPCPRVVYDSRKIQLSDSEAVIYTENGLLVTTQLIDVGNLTLYKLLDFAFVSGCGFASVQTDLPNYEISRLDFPLTATYLESISGLVGLYKPLLTVIGNTLRIQRKTPIPADFNPPPMTPSSYSSYSENLSGRVEVDGIILEYQESGLEINVQTTRSEYKTDETGTYGANNYTRTTTTRQIRDYKSLTQPNIIFKSEIISEIRTTYDYLLNLIARETETHRLDRQGKRKSSNKITESLVPNLNNAGALSLLTTRDELTNYSYKPDPKNVRRSLQNRTVTQIRGIIAVDSDNTYFDRAFKQDFTEAHKAGNLRDGMTSDFGPVKTITETLQTLGNGQTQISVQTIDHLRNTITNSISETRAGEAALNGDGQNPRRMVIYRPGYTKTKKHASLSVGELPLFFALPLAKLELNRIINGETNASIEIAGFSENFGRGTFFDVLNRAGGSLGINLCEGYSIEGSNLGTTNQRITTRIEAAIIKRET